MNTTEMDNNGQRIRATYGGNLDRLLSIKQRSADNLFRVNRNLARVG